MWCWRTLYAELKDKVDFRFCCEVERLEIVEEEADAPAASSGRVYRVYHANGSDDCEKCIISVGRSGSKWMQDVCGELAIRRVPTAWIWACASGTPGGNIFPFDRRAI